MPEQRSCVVAVSLESTFTTLLEAQAARSNKTVSAYVRTLIIQALRMEGLVNEEILHKVLIS